jgi:hypothetical protein
LYTSLLPVTGLLRLGCITLLFTEDPELPAEAEAAVVAQVSPEPPVEVVEEDVAEAAVEVQIFTLYI